MASSEPQTSATPMQVLDAILNRAEPSHPPRTSARKLLELCDLSVSYYGDSGLVLRRVSLTILAGKIIGLLGESGCGKTTTALSIMGLLPQDAQIQSGEVRFQGHDLLKFPEQQLRKVRGSQVSIIYQHSDVLNPVMRVGDQVLEVLRAHVTMADRHMRDEVLSLFELLGLDDCERIFHAYPHQLSGGQRRRISIAQALVCKPQLVIADEPTAWLDPDAATEILILIKKMRDRLGTAFLLIAHDPEALAAVADEVLVMYGGQVVETGPIGDVLAHPSHPYTQALLQCCQRASRTDSQMRNRSLLPCIPGQAPDPAQSSGGCSFSGRCSERVEPCTSADPELVTISGKRSVRCFRRGQGA